MTFGADKLLNAGQIRRFIAGHRDFQFTANATVYGCRRLQFRTVDVNF